MRKTSILLAFAMVAGMAITAQAGTIALADDFDTDSSGTATNQNLNYLVRQTGTDAPNAWDNLNLDDQSNTAWNNRVTVTDEVSGHQLHVMTGIGEQGLWNPGQTNLPQSSTYTVSFDIKGVSGWAFVRFNSLVTGDGTMECGVLVSATDWVQLWENGTTVYNPGATTPAGSNGLHHVEVNVTNGIAKITVDVVGGSGGWQIQDRDWTGIGTGAAGIGYFSVFGQQGSDVYLDNFVYESDAVSSSPWITDLIDTYDTGISSATNDQNLAYAVRQSGAGAPNAWDNLALDDYSGGPGGTNDWTGRVSVTDQASHHQLKISTGFGEQGFWNPGQTDLVQSSQYKISFDVKGSNDWAFVRFNSTQTSNNLECGFLVSATDWVQLFENGNAVFVPGSTTPTGANGLHHIEVTVIDGFADIDVDGGSGAGGWSVTGRDWSGIGTGTNGIGYFSVFSKEGADAYLDNIVYQVIPSFAPPSIVELTPVGGNVMKMVVNLSGYASSYVPESNTDLVGSIWTNVPHSDDGLLNPYVVTNFDYSTSQGTNKVIYVQSDTAAKFFRVTD